MLSVLELLNYCLVLIFGLFLTADIAGGCKTKQQKRLIFALCPVFLLLQGVFFLLCDVRMVECLYPLIVHLPLVLILIFVLKKPAGIALISVCTAYLCCQLPRWLSLVAAAFTTSPWVVESSYTLLIIPIFFLLRRFFAPAASEAIACSSQSLLLFGSLPMAYYLFDYATTIYSDALHIGIHALNEFLPTILIFFYIAFLTAYHVQAQKRSQAELQSSMLEAELKQSEMEMESLRRTEKQTAIYHHDIRHHMTMLEGFLAAGKPQQAAEYIKKIQSDLDKITPRRFCENDPINLLCSSFSGKAEHLGIRLSVTANLPKVLPLSDTELCSVVSNGLENALHAVTPLDEPYRWIEFYCDIRMNKLLIEIKNPYDGEVILRDGLPVSHQSGHGYGCHSICAITRQHHGLCSFEPDGRIFTLRVVFPAHDSAVQG